LITEEEEVDEDEEESKADEHFTAFRRVYLE
jgi:hypothetical protein